MMVPHLSIAWMMMFHSKLLGRERWWFDCYNMAFRMVLWALHLKKEIKISLLLISHIDYIISFSLPTILTPYKHGILMIGYPLSTVNSGLISLAQSISLIWWVMVLATVCWFSTSSRKSAYISWQHAKASDENSNECSHDPPRSLFFLVSILFSSFLFSCLGVVRLHFLKWNRRCVW